MLYEKRSLVAIAGVVVVFPLMNSHSKEASPWPQGWHRVTGAMLEISLSSVTLSPSHVSVPHNLCRLNKSCLHDVDWNSFCGVLGDFDQKCIEYWNLYRNYTADTIMSQWSFILYQVIRAPNRKLTPKNPEARKMMQALVRVFKNARYLWCITHTHYTNKIRKELPVVHFHGSG